MVLFLTILHVSVCIFLIVIVLLQHGKGADIGASFGGASQTVFGTRGAATFLSKLTVSCAIIFMVTSLSLAYLSSRGSAKSLFAGRKPQPKSAAASAVPASAPATAVPASTPSVATTATPKESEAKRKK
ncbi:MAG TPA: preprotein translocase subunit SecG [Bdellovibrionota bacterium]|nr:preprotein translocase subunit SecG [Bdellovibrionota bacterium]